MTRRPRVPGLSERWAEHQLELLAVDGDGAPLDPSCASCTAVPGQPGAWDCDPDRPGCPLRAVPEQSRDRCSGDQHVIPHNGCVLR